MQKIQTKNQYQVKFFTVLKGTAVVIYAVAFRKEGSELIAVSEPRIVKIIQKKQAVLKGSVKITSKYFLAGNKKAKKATAEIKKKIASPYFSETIFQTGFIAAIGARAPSRVA